MAPTHQPPERWIDYGDGLRRPLPRTTLTLKHELGRWWRERADAEIDMVVDKAIEYGATDLLDIGHQLARSAGRTITDTEAAEWGVAFYALGKMSRIMAAIAEGREPSADSWLDLGVYARMAQRIKDCGGWPTPPAPDDIREEVPPGGPHEQ